MTHRHPDHMGGAAALHRATGAPVVTHPEERDPVQQNMKGVSVGKVAQDGERLELGWLNGPVCSHPGAHLGQPVSFRSRTAGAVHRGQRPGAGDHGHQPRRWGSDSAIYPELHETARRQIRSHLRKLEKEERVHPTDSDTSVLVYPCFSWQPSAAWRGALCPFAEQSPQETRAGLSGAGSRSMSTSKASRALALRSRACNVARIAHKVAIMSSVE